MTYLEKYKKDQPGLSDDECRRFMIKNCPYGLDGKLIHCPRDLRIIGMPNDERCPICWNREIPGTEPTNNKTANEREDGNMSKKFTKSDLKVGYVVKCRNGNMYMVMFNDRDELAFARNHGQMAMDCYDTELKCVSIGGEDFDVMEVYGRTSLYTAAIISTNDRKLLWKREEKTCDSCAHKVVCTHVGMCEHYMEKAK